MKVQPIEKKLIINDNIKKIIGDKTLSAIQVTREMSNKSKSNIRSTMANMVRDGELDCIRCINCEVGKTYRVKKHVS